MRQTVWRHFVVNDNGKRLGDIKRGFASAFRVAPLAD